MNKITSKPYRIICNAFIDVGQEILAYTFFCKCIYSLKQCIKKTYKNKKFIKPIKIKKGFRLRKVC